jgi:hypothetical protein
MGSRQWLQDKLSRPRGDRPASAQGHHSPDKCSCFTALCSLPNQHMSLETQCLSLLEHICQTKAESMNPKIPGLERTLMFGQSREPLVPAASLAGGLVLGSIVHNLQQPHADLCSHQGLNLFFGSQRGSCPNMVRNTSTSAGTPLGMGFHHLPSQLIPINQTINLSSSR